MVSFHRHDFCFIEALTGRSRVMYELTDKKSFFIFDKSSMNSDILYVEDVDEVYWLYRLLYMKQYDKYDLITALKYNLQFLNQIEL